MSSEETNLHDALMEANRQRAQAADAMSRATSDYIKADRRANDLWRKMKDQALSKEPS